jgi:hypothetical protein
MKYTKPEVMVLGDAGRLIESQLKQQAGVDSPINDGQDPAYDLDE